MSFLKKIDLFRSVPDDLLAQIGGQMETIRIPEGDVLMKEGEQGDLAFVIVDGEIRIEKGGVTIVKAGPGETVGEFALIDDGVRSASAVAESEVVLLQWGRGDFQNTLSTSPEVAVGILKVLTGKLRINVDSWVVAGLEKERWRQDLMRANEIQTNMLPQEDLRTDDIEITGICRPADRVAGDYYDYLPLANGRLAMMISDATGHGFYAGLFVAMAKSCLLTQVHIDDAPEKVMEAMNQTVLLSIESGLLMTGCYTRIDPSDGSLVYTNAGHNYPIHYRKDIDGLEPLKSTDLLLGMPISWRGGGFKSETRPWGSGDILVFYSDGITEAMDGSKEMFEDERLEGLVMDYKGRSVQEIRDAILDDLENHTEGVKQQDDVTLVVAKAT